MRTNATGQREVLALPRNTSQQIIDGWRDVYDSLREHGQDDLARSVRTFTLQIKAQQEKQQASAQTRRLLTPERERWLGALIEGWEKLPQIVCRDLIRRTVQ